MASVLVFIDRDGDLPARESREVLGEGRRIASRLGATLYAVATVVEESIDADHWITSLGEGGADKVLLLSEPRHAGPAVWATHGDALASACQLGTPLLVLMAANAAGRDLAPRLAARLGASFTPEPILETGLAGELVLTSWAYGHRYRRRLDTERTGAPAVATLTPGSLRTAEGEDEAEVLFFEPLETSLEGLERVGGRPDPGGALESARVVVGAGAGVSSQQQLDLLATLATALGGELGATRSLVARGLAPRDREIDVGGHSVGPDLYVACAASGSAAHLGAVASSAEIVAINRDPDAPICRAATYSVIGDIDEVVPALIRAIEARASRVAS